TTTAGSAASATAPAESSPRGLGTSFIHVQGAAVHLGAVELRNRGFRLALVGHLDKRETPGLSCVAIRHDVHAIHVPVLGERRMQLILGGLEAQISNEDIHLE